MFNLEQAVSEWRRQMFAAGIKTPVPLDELEMHLRESIEQQMKSGLDEQKAFEIAVGRMGQAGPLKMEFKKIERKQMKRVLAINAGVIGVLVGMAFVMPAVSLYQNEGTMTVNDVGLLLLGLV